MALLLYLIPINIFHLNLLNKIYHHYRLKIILVNNSFFILYFIYFQNYFIYFIFILVLNLNYFIQLFLTINFILYLNCHFKYFIHWFLLIYFTFLITLILIKIIHLNFFIPSKN